MGTNLPDMGGSIEFLRVSSAALLSLTRTVPPFIRSTHCLIIPENWD